MWLAFLLAMLPIVLWILMVAQRVGWIALWNNMLHEVLLRGTETSWPHYGMHILSYPVHILGACAPFSLVLLTLCNNKLRDVMWSRHRSVVEFISIAVLTNFPLYWLKGNVAVRYFLPMFPFLLLLSALSYDSLRSFFALSNRRWPRILLPALVIFMLLLRSIEFFIFFPIKIENLARTHNASAIIADIVQYLPNNRPLFVSNLIPSAIWFYAELNSMRLLNREVQLVAGDVILRHESLDIPNIFRVKIKSYRYANDLMLLERVVK